MNKLQIGMKTKIIRELYCNKCRATCKLPAEEKLIGGKVANSTVYNIEIAYNLDLPTYWGFSIKTFNLEEEPWCFKKELTWEEKLREKRRSSTK